MRRIPLYTLATALLALGQVSCGKSVVGPTPGSVEEPILASSFERAGLPTLEGWRIINPSVTTLVPEPAPGGGRWSLGLEADWAPTTGFIVTPVPGIRDGDVLRLSASVRAVDAHGGGAIVLAVGPQLYGRGSRAKSTGTTSTAWTRVSVLDTVSLASGDTVWVALSSLHTEVIRRQGRFDLVTLSRIRKSDRTGTR